jgi:N6-L-threonylcarbamoyladenine synthase
MIILGIETSCDDTAIAVIKVSGKKRPKIEILADFVSSQVKIHQKYGGVYPFLAKREHKKNLPLVLKKAFKKVKPSEIDLLAVTVGPGLDPCLWEGVNFATKLSQELKVPLIPINHIEAHIFANLITPIKKEKIFPAVCLIVSGGHTQLILVKDFGNYQLLGETRDDAAGECFDKIARILGLGYPGGPAIEEKASGFKNEDSRLKTTFPRPMIHQKNYDFSFSGLKTAVLYHHRKQKAKVKKSEEYIKAISFEAQQAIIDVLIKKTLKAAKDYKVKSIILGGGVSANKELRKQLKLKIKKELPGINYIVPNIKYSTDNAVMIAMTAYYYRLRGHKKDWKDIKANANLKIG